MTRRILTADIAGEKHHVHFDLLDHEAPDTSIDGFISCVLFKAMEIGDRMFIRGAVERDTLINIREYADAWACLRPERYKRIDINADEVVGPRPISTGPAIMAFSSGVDSMFSMLCRTEPDTLRPVKEAMFVSLAGARSDEEITAYTNRLRPLLRERGVHLNVMTCNLKQVFRQDIEDSYAARYVSCLHNFEHLSSFAYLASGESYLEQVIPFGSSPSTDHLLSTPAMKIVLDGASYTRTEKAGRIAKDKHARSVVHVCGRKHDSNCGVCGKCVRTRMNFLAHGVDPECMPGKFELDQIDAIGIPHSAARLELESLSRYCVKHGVKEPWLARLNARIAAPVQSKFARRVKKLRRHLHI
ncbi:hypothetical protein GCM10010869_71820 [Mesorhizobium tianshanense]|uniref:7-cyano-7-deazaguanine synthase in queuosine biosynthesis n=2 Tax=Mesorhizobium tianshanense TaxID=39844 RepID=A0A562P421_9HYPH|nr:hypothetical protein IQ26_01998 [Mesorhizobium tianshanense]GLS41585.1 hypothetical protein GCM10010869_71820 [Mesorhizobium tianshanense]